MKTVDLPKIQDVDLKDKVVLVRVDHNVVKKGVIHDPYRIDATIGTLYYIVARGGKLILMTHVGRPRDKKTGAIRVSEDTSVRPIVDYLRSKLHVRMEVPEFPVHGDRGYLGVATSVNHLIRKLNRHESDGIYLPNTRWFSGEEAGGEEADRFANELAGLADVFVNDAFGSWQPHASTVDVTRYLPSYAGFLMQKEIEGLDRIYDARRPFVAVVAGSKFDTKIDSLYKLLETADHLVLGGVIYNAYLCAKYGIHVEGIGEDDIEHAHAFVDFAAKHAEKLVELPLVVESDTTDGRVDGKFRTRRVADLKKGDELRYVLDIDADSFADERVRRIFLEAKTIFVNAVMGMTPHFNEGTMALDQLIDENEGASRLYGGGDTMQELKRLLPGLYIVALDHPRYYIFTGGGAVLKAIEAGTPEGLTPVRVLAERVNR